MKKSEKPDVSFMCIFSVIKHKNVITQVRKMHSLSNKMYQKSFGGRAPPGPAGGAQSAPPDPLAGLKAR